MSEFMGRGFGRGNALSGVAQPDQMQPQPLSPPIGQPGQQGFGNPFAGGFFGGWNGQRPMQPQPPMQQPQGFGMSDLYQRLGIGQPQQQPMGGGFGMFGQPQAQPMQQPYPGFLGWPR